MICPPGRGTTAITTAFFFNCICHFTVVNALDLTWPERVEQGQVRCRAAYRPLEFKPRCSVSSRRAGARSQPRAGICLVSLDTLNGPARSLVPITDDAADRRDRSRPGAFCVVGSETSPMSCPPPSSVSSRRASRVLSHWAA